MWMFLSGIQQNAGAACSARAPPNPAETRVPYLPRVPRQTPIKRGCHMFHACPAESIRNTGAICSTRAPPNSNGTRVPHVPRRARGPPPNRGCRMSRSHGNAGAVCSTRAPQNPSEIQVDFVVTLQKRGCHIFHACPAESSRNASAICCDPSETRVPYDPRAPSGIHQKYRWILLRPQNNASAICSTQGPRNPSEMQVDYVATLQKRECHMFHAGPAKSSRNQGALCCTSIFGSKILIMHAGPARPK